MITLIPIGVLSKEIVSRPRPFIPETEILLAADSQYAYPSGHSMIVAAGAAVVLFIFSIAIIRQVGRGKYYQLC